MRNVYDCVEAFEKLLDKEYHLVLGRKNKSVSLQINFDKKEWLLNYLAIPCCIKKDALASYCSCILILISYSVFLLFLNLLNPSGWRPNRHQRICIVFPVLRNNTIHPVIFPCRILHAALKIFPSPSKRIPDIFFRHR